MLKQNRPLGIRLFNKLMATKPLNVDKLVEKAQQKTGLQNFGEEDIYIPLQKLVDSINQEANLHPFGAFITKQRLLNVLQNRLLVENCIKHHPEILDIEIKNPIIIAGLQRTGTTRLHRLLSGHQNIRSLQSWEALNPNPLKNDKANKKRIRFAKTAEKALKYMSPDFFAIHPVEYDAPEEDILLNDMTFISTVPEATMWVPSYAKWVQEQSHLMPYSYLKKTLQLLSWQNPEGRWVLKSPQYMEFLDEALQIFPDAKIIHTTRDPIKIIGSFSSMV